MTDLTVNVAKRMKSRVWRSGILLDAESWIVPQRPPPAGLALARLSPMSLVFRRAIQRSCVIEKKRAR